MRIRDQEEMGGIQKRSMKYLTIPLLLLTATCLCLLSWHVSATHDIWWQMANGRLIMESGKLVSCDPYTFTIKGTPYFDKYWLYELLTYRIFSMLGWKGLALLLQAMVFAGLAALIASIKREPMWLLLAAAVPAILLIDLRILLRAYWFTLIILPVYLRFAQKYFLEKKQHTRDLVIVCLAQILWTNLHGEFFWGLLASGLFCAEGVFRICRDRQERASASRLIFGYAAVLLSTMLNPFGWRLPLEIVREAFLVTSAVESVEWLPFVRVARPLPMAAWAIMILLTGLSLGAAGKKASIALLGLFTCFALLSLYSMRFLGIFVVMAIFTMMEHGSHIKTSPALKARLDLLSSAAAIMGILCIAWSLAFGFFYTIQGELKLFGSGLLTSEFPVRSSEFLREHNIRGRFLNAWSHGGYLIWHNRPEIEIAHDGRTAPFPPELLSRLQAVINGNAEEFEDFAIKYKPDGAIVPWQYTKLAQLLAASEDWSLLYLGPNASVWMNTTSLVSQDKQGLILKPGEIDKFVLRDNRTAHEQEPFLSFRDHAERRAIFFQAIDRNDLAEAQRDAVLKED